LEDNLKRTLVYSDLGNYIRDQRKADSSNDTVRGMYNAWNKFESLLPDIVDTAITDEDTDAFVERFKKAAEGDISDTTIRNYVKSFQLAARWFCESGTLSGPSDPMPQVGTTLTYGDMYEYVLAFAEDNPGHDKARRWVSTYEALAKRLPEVSRMRIDGEHTEQIMDRFARTATDLKPGTISTYGHSFRQATRIYCDAVKIDYTEVDAEERRHRRSRAKAEAKAKAQARAKAKADAEEKAELASPPEPVADTAAEPQPEEAVQPELTGYNFLLRASVVVTLALPDNLTHAEADRLNRWIGSFVIDDDGQREPH
jgi:hypothetical protein